MQNNKPETINLTVRSKQGALIDKQDVFAITSKNIKGVFDVLPEHENFISLIKDYLVVHKTRKEKQEIKLDSGVIKVNENEVKVFIGVHSD